MHLLSALWAMWLETILELKLEVTGLEQPIVPRPLGPTLIERHNFVNFFLHSFLKYLCAKIDLQ